MSQGEYAKLGRTQLGATWSWGYNPTGVLGDETIISKSSPVQVVGNHSFSSVQTGESSTDSASGFAASRSMLDGTAWCWGDNDNGQLGDNSTTNKSSPISVVGAHSFIIVTIGGTMCAGLKESGQAWMWGQNTSGQLGDNSKTNRSSPVLVVGAHSFITIACGDQHSVAAKTGTDGTWAWGSNAIYGQLGDNSTTTKSSPVSVVGAHYFTQVECGVDHSMGLKANGTVWCWGSGLLGKLGNSSTSNRSSPVSVVGAHSFIQISASVYTSFGLKANGEVWSWGNSASGILGNYVLPLAHTSSPVSVIGNHSFAKISSEAFNCYALKDDGSVWAWGGRDYGAIGDDIDSEVESPISVIGEHVFTAIDIHAVSTSMSALKADGTAWVWGDNTNGQLGDNSLVPKSSPVQVAGAHSFVQLVSGTSVGHGRKTNGEIWSWGSGLALGDNTTTTKSSPVLVVGGHVFTDVSSGDRFVIALKGANGSAWMWGQNNFGQLGDNSKTNRSSPVSVLGAHSFTKITAGGTAIGGGHTAAMKANGEVWCWGAGGQGQLGDLTKTDKSSPVFVVGNHSFVNISSGLDTVFGLKADGTVWGWGFNDNGQLGDNSLIGKSSPVQVTGAHSFVSVVGGDIRTIAVKDDGTTWSWGNNDNGELGDGTKVTKSSPVLVIGSHLFDEACSGSASIGRKSDGTVWTWGSRGEGALGDGLARYAASPVQIVGDITFVDIGSGFITISSNRNYMRGDENVLPADDTNLEIIFSSSDYDDVETDNAIRVSQFAGNQFAIFLFKDQNDTGFKGKFTVHWDGQSTRAPASSRVHLQIYNRNTATWKTIDSNNSEGASVDFLLSSLDPESGESLSDYYDESGWIACRVYQEAT